MRLPTGYHLQWSGLWEHLESGRNRLLLVVPVTFFIVFLLLFATFQSLRQAALIFTGIPFAVTGGVLSLLMRDMTFSMSAGVGFIAVSGVAVLNGVVMLAFFNQLRTQERSVAEAVAEGAGVNPTEARAHDCVYCESRIRFDGCIQQRWSYSARLLATVVIGHHFNAAYAVGTAIAVRAG